MSDKFYEEGTGEKSSKKPNNTGYEFSKETENPFNAANKARNSKRMDITDIKPVKIQQETPKPTFTVNIAELQDGNSSLSQMKKTVPASRPKPQLPNNNYANNQTRHINTQKPSEIQEITPEILKKFSANKDKTVNINTGSIAAAIISGKDGPPANNASKPAQQISAEQRKAQLRAAAQKRAKEKRDKQNARNKAFIKFCACFLIILLLSSSLTTMAVDTLNDILVFDANDNSFAVAVTIPSGADFDTVYDILCEKGLVDQTFITKLFCIFRDYDQDEFEAGVYYLESTNGIESMLETIKDSSSSSSETVSLTFPEGYTIAQIFEKLEYYEVCTAEKLYANLSIVASEYDFYDGITDNYGRYLDVEGYLFPNTYEFYIGETPSSVLCKLFDDFELKWTDEYDARLEELGMTMDEIIIIASIIQKEAANSSQMADISSVLHNRLDDSSTFPQLQFNSTTDYIIALKEYDLFTDFYYDFYLDAYNTYSVTGLPPGAICNPGISAIEAALYPSETDYVYFCHDDDGNVYLASTAQEHYVNTQYIL